MIHTFFYSRIPKGALLVFFTGMISLLQAQDKMDFEDYDPPTTLKVEEHHITKAKFPFIDIHNHQFGMANQDLSGLIREMDKLNMTVMVNLSGRGGGNGQIEGALSNVKQHYPKRFVVFTNIDFSGIGEAGWVEKAVKRLEDDVKLGAMGLKIYKSLGMSVRDNNGKRVSVDDSRIDPIWAKCGELGIPVLIHSADPKSFWDPYDKNNERWLEVKINPDRRHDKDPVKWETIIEEQHRMFGKHPKTKFINAHLGWYGNDLKKLGELMDQYPNMYTEIGAVIAELGRQPKEAKTFLTKYQDRVLFGKDSWVPSEYETYFRVLESEDEYFPYHKRYHAFWKMYGIGLPDNVLKKIYYKNALTLLRGVDKSMFPN